MSRKRKPVAKPMLCAADAIYWRGTVLTEMLEGITLPPQLAEPIKRMRAALEDYDASKQPRIEEPPTFPEFASMKGVQ
jgi:hypothetical protein